MRHSKQRIERPARREFLVGCVGLVAASMVVKASDDASTTFENPNDWRFDDESGQGGISVSLHLPGGGSFPEDAKVIVIDTVGKEIILSRGNGQDVYFKYLPAGHYKVCAEAGSFGRSCNEVDTTESEVLMLPIFLGKDGWPSFQIGGARVPFEPVLDKVGIVFNRPFWRVSDSFEKYRALVESIGLTPDIRNPSNKNSFIGAKGGVLYLKSKNGEAIFSKSTNAPHPAIADELAKRLRSIFSNSEFGEVRIGLPLASRKSLARVLDNRFLVRFAPHMSKEKIKDVEISNGATARKIGSLENVWELKFDEEFNYFSNLSRIEQLLNTGLVTQAEPNLVFELENHAPQPNDPWYLCQKHIQVQKIDSAWALLGVNRLGNPHVTVTTIDSGVNRSTISGHPDLDANSVICVDLLQNSTPQELKCESVPTDAHGMSVYGIIGAAHNDRGVAGIAPNTTHVAIRMCDASSFECYATMLRWAGGFIAAPSDIDGNVISGIPAVTPASVINCSHGIEEIPLSWVINDAFRELATQGRNGKGTLLVYSAGQNGGTNTLFGANVQCVQAAALSRHTMIIANTVSVSCHCGRETHDPSSNFGRRIDLCAFGGLDDPTSYGGVSLSGEGPSLLFDNTQDTMLPACSSSPSFTNGVTRFGRTSAAAAMVSGVAALMLSERGVTKAKLRTLVRKTADKIDSSCPPPGGCPGSCCNFFSCGSTVGRWMEKTSGGWASVSGPNGLPKGLGSRSDWYGYGRLDAYAALSATLLEPS